MSEPSWDPPRDDFELRPISEIEPEPFGEVTENGEDHDAEQRSSAEARPPPKPPD